jgi:hypothetical protein
MNPKKALTNLSFVGEVVAKKQTYYVYENAEEYILMSVNRRKENSFNFNVVSKEATNYVRKAFNGREQLTSSDLVNESKKPIYIKETFDALNVLYALCAAGYAKIDHRFKKGQSLYFNVRNK